VDEIGIPSVSALNWLLAFAPVGVLLVLMVGFSWGGAKAGPAAWLTALVVAVWRFGAGADLLAFSQGKAALLSIWVLSIIWAALLLFHVVNEAGAVKTIGHGVSRVTENRLLQVLLLAWIFTTFLQGIAGYGVPVAVVAPLMVGLGFSPVAAVVTTSVGHSWSVTFGSLGASFFALSGVSLIPGQELALESGVFLGIACFLCGFGAVWAYGGINAVYEALPPLLIVGTLMAGTQLALALAGAYSLAAFTAGCVGLVAMAGMARLPRFRLAPVRPADLPPVQGGDGGSDAPNTPASLREIALAFSAYAVLIVIVLSASLIEPLNQFLGRVAVRLSFPETATSFGWTNTATDSYRTIEPFGDAGALLIYASVIGYLIYRRSGKLPAGAWRVAAGKTINGAVGSSLGIVTMVGMALIMMESGMTFLLAKGAVDVAGPVFPLTAPFVGVLGCFMTGSNTNSNILFGALQRDSAVLLGLPPALLLAAQTTGGAIGSMLAPAKIIVGCSTVGLNGQEGPVIRQSVRYGLVITSVIGVITLVWSWLV
jgi:lactate permease